MAQQQSFLGTVRKQMHSVYTIIRLLMMTTVLLLTFDNSFYLTDSTSAQKCLSKQNTTVLLLSGAMTNFCNQCTVCISSC